MARRWPLSEAYSHRDKEVNIHAQLGIRRCRDFLALQVQGLRSNLENCKALRVTKWLSKFSTKNEKTILGALKDNYTMGNGMVVACCMIRLTTRVASYCFFGSVYTELFVITGFVIRHCPVLQDLVAVLRSMHVLSGDFWKHNIHSAFRGWTFAKLVEDLVVEQLKDSCGIELDLGSVTALAD